MSVVISLQGVGKSFAGRPVLHDVDLEKRHGHVVGIVGPSGSGKSMLLRTINQLERHDPGQRSRSTARRSRTTCRTASSSRCARRSG